MINNEKDQLELKTMMAEMTNIISKMIQLSINAFVEKDIDIAKQVIKMDKKVDQLDIEIDELCLKILALYNPKAHSLRNILGSSRIIVDLERIGDYCVNICHDVLKICKLKEIGFSDILSQMGKIVIEMMKEAVNAFFQNDITRAKEVMIKDDQVDHLHAIVIRTLMNNICDRPAKTQMTMCIMAIARSLERIGDHATSIAESAYFLVDGKIVRHSQI